MAFVKLADNYTDLIGKFAVALLAEGVDRNTYTVPNGRDHAPVALLAEGVDRNKLRIPAKFFKHSSPSSRRAWIEIDTFHTIRYICRTSPSSRRAWIEIRSAPGPRPRPCVALLAEGVDRNSGLGSPLPACLVALLAEGGDRNQSAMLPVDIPVGRPPRGGRG